MAKKIQMSIHGHLLIPFGSAKWNIDKIRIVGVSTKATYFESETPCVYIDMSKKVALRLRNLRDVFPDEFPYNKDDVWDVIPFIYDYLKEKCNVQTESERRFLDLGEFGV